MEVVDSKIEEFSEKKMSPEMCLAEVMKTMKQFKQFIAYSKYTTVM